MWINWCLAENCIILIIFLTWVCWLLGSDVENELWHQKLPWTPAATESMVHLWFVTLPDGHPPKNTPPSSSAAISHSGQLRFNPCHSVLSLFMMHRWNKDISCNDSSSPQISAVTDTRSVDPTVVEMGQPVHRATVSCCPCSSSHKVKRQNYFTLLMKNSSSKLTLISELQCNLCKKKTNIRQIIFNFIFIRKKDMFRSQVCSEI